MSAAAHLERVNNSDWYAEKAEQVRVQIEQWVTEQRNQQKKEDLWQFDVYIGEEKAKRYAEAMRPYVQEYNERCERVRKLEEAQEFARQCEYTRKMKEAEERGWFGKKQCEQKKSWFSRMLRFCGAS